MIATKKGVVKKKNAFKPIKKAKPSKKTKETSEPKDERPKNIVNHKYINVSLKESVLSKERADEKEAKEQVKQGKKSVQLLLPEDTGFLVAEENERTYDITQQQIADEVDIRAASKAFDLVLNEFAPYQIDYTQSGKYLVMGGAKGHIATMEWDTKKLLGEFHIKTPVRDIAFLHTFTMIAVAQKRYSYIYDQNGVELHCLKNHHDVTHLQYLPYHFLLASVNAHGALTYQDISTGELVARHNYKQGLVREMKQNPQNAIIHLGHTSGLVSMWSPNSPEAVVTMRAHRAPISTMAIDRTGRYMVTAGMDAKMNIFDIRTWTPLFQCKRYNIPNTMDISQKDVLAIGSGSTVQMWKNPFAESSFELYMQHKTNGGVHSVKYCPFEDVLGVGHQDGFSSLLVPGSGEPNFDSMEANPLQTKKQRSRFVVTALLDKIPHNMISLDRAEFGLVIPEQLTVEEEIKRTHPSFYNMKHSNRPVNKEQKRVLEREVRRRTARKIESIQKEEGEKRREQQDKGDIMEDTEYSALDRFKKKNKIVRMAPLDDAEKNKVQKIEEVKEKKNKEKSALSTIRKTGKPK